MRLWLILALVVVACSEPQSPRDVFRVPSDAGYQLEVASTGEAVAGHGGGRPLVVWRRVEAKWRAQLRLPRPSAVSFSHNGRYLAVALWESGVGVWDVQSLKRIMWIPSDRLVTHIATDDLGSSIAAAFYYDDILRVYRRDGMVAELEGLETITDVKVNTASHLLAVAYKSGVNVYSVPTGALVLHLPRRRRYSGVIDFSPDGSYIAAARTEDVVVAPDGYIDLVSTATRRVEKTLDSPDAVDEVAVGPDGRVIVVTYANRLVHLTKSPVREQCCHYAIDSIVISSADPRQVFTTGGDATVALWTFR